MEQIINTLDNWSIVKIVGGLTIIVPAIIGFVSYLLQSRLLDRWRANDQKELEILKGTIERNNSVLTSILSKSQPDFILVKKLDAIEKIWNFAIGTKRNVPASVTLAFSILIDDEFTMDSLRKYSKGQFENISFENIVMKNKLITDFDNLRYLLPPKLWTLVFIYQATINRSFHLLVDGYQKGKPVYWKNDESINSMLKTSLEENELNYIYGLKIQSMDVLLNILEYKILNEINKVLTGEAQVEDNLQVARRITALQKNKIQ